MSNYLTINEAVRSVLPEDTPYSSDITVSLNQFTEVNGGESDAQTIPDALANALGVAGGGGSAIDQVITVSFEKDATNTDYGTIKLSKPISEWPIYSDNENTVDWDKFSKLKLVQGTIVTYAVDSTGNKFTMIDIGCITHVDEDEITHSPATRSGQMIFAAILGDFDLTEKYDRIDMH